MRLAVPASHTGTEPPPFAMRARFLSVGLDCAAALRCLLSLEVSFHFSSSLARSIALFDDPSSRPYDLTFAYIRTIGVFFGGQRSDRTPVTHSKMLLRIVLSLGIAGSGVLADSISLFNPYPGAPITACPAGVRSSLPTSKTKRNEGAKQADVGCEFRLQTD